MLFGSKAAKAQPQPPAPMPQPDTEAPNAQYCMWALDALMSQKKARGAVLKLYLENFKTFNDTFGHDCGEQLLKEIRVFLCGLPDAQVLRYRGVEFLIVFDRYSFTQAEQAAHDIQDRFEAAWHIDGMDYMCSISLGMLLYPDAAENAEEAFKFLDYALTDASQRGQNQLSVCNSELRQKLYRRRGIARLVREAVQSGAIEVRYRPTFHMEKNIFTRAECYLRICSQEFGIVGAAEFIPAAEDSGLICAVNEFAIRAACAEIRRLLDAGVVFESIAVPISPVQFLQETFMDTMQSILEEYQIPPKKLGFEISESLLVNSLNRTIIVMQELSDMGIEFVLNEFGTGYSGINNILDLPVDVLKLERMFVWQLETNPRSSFVIEGLIQIAHKLGLKLIAEGVETENQVSQLTSFGCRYAQGFYYSPTLGAADLTGLLGNGTDAVPAQSAGVWH